MFILRRYFSPSQYKLELTTGHKIGLQKSRWGLPATRRTTRSEGSNCRMAKGWCLCHSSKACRSISISFSKLHFFTLHKILTLVLKGWARILGFRSRIILQDTCEFLVKNESYTFKAIPGKLDALKSAFAHASRATISHFLATVALSKCKLHIWNPNNNNAFERRCPIAVCFPCWNATLRSRVTPMWKQ